MIENREISEGHARAIKARGISKEAQLTLATRAVREKLTVRDVEKLVKEIRGRQTSPSMAGRNPDQQRLEEKISNKLGYTAQFRKGWLQLYIGEDADAVNEFLQRIGGILDT
jgi:ParB-like chromosome segregation protein Spo0J